MKIPLFIFIFFLLFSGSTVFAQANSFTPTQVKADLLYYKTQLERYHPGFYRYNTKAATELFFDSLLSLVKVPMTLEQVYGLFTLSSGWVKDGHTVLLPPSAAIERYNTTDRFLPFQPGISGDTLFVRQVWSPEAPFREGSLITSINGVPAGELIRQLRIRQVRDGLQTAYADWILDRYFKEYYGFVFGHPPAYSITYSKDGEQATVELPGLRKDSIAKYKSMHYPSHAETKGVELNWKDSVPVLTIRSFDDELLKSGYGQFFRTEIRLAFQSLKQVAPKSLVIDLRDNQGGDIENGVLLLSYLLDHPFQVVEQYSCLKNGKQVPCKGPMQGWHQPQKLSFRGTVVVLVNGGSFSNSVIVASALRKNKRAWFLGTMTGGNPVVLTGDAKAFRLPETGIEVEIPRLEYGVRVLTEKNTGLGLMPDVVVYRSIAADLSGQDPVLDMALQFLQRKLK